MAVEYTARETEVKLAKASDVTITALAGLETFFGTSTTISGVAKNITITAPDVAQDKEDFLGETSNFQNQSFHEKPVSEAKATFTMKFTHDSAIWELIGGSGTAISTTHTRYQVGSSETGKTKVDVSILFTLVNSDGTTNIVLDNAKLTKHGDLKLSGADGYWEQDIEITCLAKDYYEEKKL